MTSASYPLSKNILSHYKSLFLKVTVFTCWINHCGWGQVLMGGKSMVIQNGQASKRGSLYYNLKSDQRALKILLKTTQVCWISLRHHMHWKCVDAPPLFEGLFMPQLDKHIYLRPKFSYTHECLKFAFVYIWRFLPVFLAPHHCAFKTKFLSEAAKAKKAQIAFTTTFSRSCVYLQPTPFGRQYSYLSFIDHFTYWEHTYIQATKARMKINTYNLYTKCRDQLYNLIKDIPTLHWH